MMPILCRTVFRKFFDLWKYHPRLQRRVPIFTYDKGYVDYAKYESLIQREIAYVTRLKGNAVYRSGEEFDIPERLDSGLLKDEEIGPVLWGGKQAKGIPVQEGLPIGIVLITDFVVNRQQL